MAKIIEITTTIGCKVNCKYCPQEQLIKSYCNQSPRETMMSMDLFKTCIDKLPNDVIVDFAGMAEPWLNENCTNMVEYAINRGHKVWIYTTLVGMSLHDIDRLANIEIEQLVIHLPDRNGYAHITIDEEYLEKLKRITRLDTVGRMSCSSQDKIDQKVEDIIKAANLDVGYEINDRAGNLQVDDVSHSVKTGTCICALSGLELSSNVLLPDGTVVLCCMDYGMNHIIGNLYTQNYEDIRNNEELSRVRQGLLDGNSYGLCKTCINALTIEETSKEYVKYRDNQDHLWNENQYLKKHLKKGLNGANDKLLEDYNKIHKWADDLTEAKIYLEEQVKLKDSRIDEITKWNEELTKTKEYFENQMRYKDKRITELEKWSAEQEKAIRYLEGQVSNKDDAIATLEAKVEECNAINYQLTENDEINRNEMNKLKYKLKVLTEDPLIKRIVKLKKYNI